MIYIKDMDMPVDCLACRISCKHESYMVIGRPKDCPLEEAKTGDLISRADAMARIANDNVVGGMERINEYNNSKEYDEYLEGISDAITTVFCDVPSADITETDGVITIEKQSAKDVGEIKHIVIHSPNYTRYFYNESMPTSAEAVHKPDYSYEADMVRRLKETLSAEAVQGEWIFRTDIPIGGGRESAGYVCSNCRKDYFHVDGMNFCPNCGARMKGADDE